MFGWIINLIGSGIFKVFGDTIVQPILAAFVKSKDVDLEKFKAADGSVERMAVAVLDANVRYAAIKQQYAITVLGWWPFRFVLFCLLAITATHFCAIVIDSTLPFIFGCKVDGQKVYGDFCTWNIPPIRGTYAEYEQQFLLFFVIAKPVDSLVSGAFASLQTYLQKRK